MSYSFTKSEIPMGSFTFHTSGLRPAKQIWRTAKCGEIKTTFDRKPVLLWPILPYQQLVRFLSE